MNFWDPLNLAAKADDATLRRYRAAELKHGRVCMLAALGTIVQSFNTGILPNPTFSETNPVNAFIRVYQENPTGFIQILIAIAAVALLGFASQLYCGGIAIAIPVTVYIDQDCIYSVIIDLFITVIVHSITEFIGTGADLRVAIIAVLLGAGAAFWGLTGLHGSAPIAIPILVHKPGRGIDRAIFIGFTIAVIVLTIADFLSMDRDTGILIIAVGGVLTIAFGQLAGPDLLATVTTAIAILIQIPGGCIGSIIVHNSITVLVCPIAALIGSRVGIA